MHHQQHEQTNSKFQQPQQVLAQQCQLNNNQSAQLQQQENLRAIQDSQTVYQAPLRESQLILQSQQMQQQPQTSQQLPSQLQATKSFKFQQPSQKQQNQIVQNIRQIRQQSPTSSSPEKSTDPSKNNSTVEESSREANSSNSEEQFLSAKHQTNNKDEINRNTGLKEKISPKKDKENTSSYAKPTLSSKFKTVKKTVNRLAKYRPTQEVPGFKKNNSGRAYRVSMDPALLQSFQALSKASISKAEAIYQEARQDFIMNSSLPVAKIMQLQNKGKENEINKEGKGSNIKENLATQLAHKITNKNANITEQKNTENWTTNIPTYTIGSSEHISPPENHKKHFKHSTPPSLTSEDEDIEVEKSPHMDISKIEEDSLPDLTVTQQAKKRILRSNSRHLE